MASITEEMAVQPNVVFILVDNIGWGNFGVYGGTVPTGASNLVPKDRPIDGVDASAFMLGKSDTTGRDSYMFCGNDGELLSIKWKHYKTVFRYTIDSPDPAIQSGYIKPQIPMMYDLSSDPHEDCNLFYTDLTNGFLFAPVFRVIAEYERSLQEYPNIKVGEDFMGYQKRAKKTA